MTVTAAPQAPQVREPQGDELRDALIREARQRARRRRLLYVGVAVGMVMTVVAVAILAGPTAPTTPLDKSFPTTVDDLLPPARAVPSSPETGELVAAVTRIHEGAWFLYADGRLISIDNTRLESGWVEQRLTAAGVERVRSEFLASGMFDLSQQSNEVPSAAETPFSNPRVRDGGRLLVGRQGTEALPGYGLPGAPPAGGTAGPSEAPGRWSLCGTQGGAKCQLIRYLRRLATSLPQNEWVAQDFTPYVPAKYSAVFIPATIRPGSITQARSGLAGLADLRSRLALMPPPVSALLGGREPASLDFAAGFFLTIADTRVLVAALIDQLDRANNATWALDLHGAIPAASVVVDVWALLPGGGPAIWMAVPRSRPPA